MLTHLDFDHAGGLPNFPGAAVRLVGIDSATANHRRSPRQRGRYRPAQRGGAGALHLYEADGEPWFGFAAVRGLHGLPPEILMIPLAGHTDGHCGIAIQTDLLSVAHAMDRQKRRAIA